MINNENPLIPHQGNYKKLFSYQKAEAIYDITYYFVIIFCRNMTAQLTR